MRRNEEVLSLLRGVDTKLERLDVALITRYPDSARAAESYEALRRALMASGSAASRHSSDLIALATAIDGGANAATVRLKIADLLRVLGIAEIPATAAEQVPVERFDEVFEVVGDGAHPQSAWVREDGVLRRGYVAIRPQVNSVEVNATEDLAAAGAGSDGPSAEDGNSTSQAPDTEQPTTGETTS